MMGVFVQTNTDSLHAKSKPVGYVIQENGCWEWIGSLSRGYGYIHIGGEKLASAHRVIYERHKGAIPEGLDLDHLCRNRACVNPDHLEPVTRRENLMRGETHTARNFAKTECVHGHPYTPENTYRDPTGCRRCRECARILMRRKNG